MSNEYKINTLVDLLDLEDDQIDRLCSELPRVIKYAKAMRDIIQAASGQDRAVVEACKIVSPLTWIDDGKTEVTCTAKFPDGSSMELNVGEQS